MAERSSYSDLLKHPRWQKRRLEILERARFSCEECDVQDRTLHVHHTYYERKHAPWEYPDESLRCLCEECHQKTEGLRTLFNRQLGKAATDLSELYGFAVAMEMHHNPTQEIEIPDYATAQGVGYYFGLSAEEIIDALTEDHMITGVAISEFPTTQGNTSRAVRMRGYLSEHSASKAANA